MHPYAAPLLVFQYNYGCSITINTERPEILGPIYSCDDMPQNNVD